MNGMLRRMIGLLIASLLFVSFSGLSVLAEGTNKHLSGMEEQKPSDRTFYSGRLMAWQANEQEMPSVQYNPRANYFPTVGADISNNIGGSVSNVNYTELTAAAMRNYMANCTIFMLHSDGTSGEVVLGPTTGTKFTVNDLTTTLSGMQCALIMTCYSAHSTNAYNTSFIQKMVNKGATCAVGFITTIYVSDCNIFAERFAAAATQPGYSVAYSISMMSTSGMNQNMVNLCVCAGNSSTYLN